MEPMNLGTPSNSGPSSPTTPSGSPYLPSFLLGEPTSPLPGSTSPKVKRGNLNDSQLCASPRYFQNQSFQNHVPNTEHMMPAERVSGPPIRGLFDTISTPKIQRDPKQPSSDANAYMAAVSKQFHDNRTPTFSSDVIESLWVTVFGFPPAAASFILSHMITCGHIVSKRVPASGNWMHVQYSSKIEVKRALGYNGKVFAGSVMIGVLPCRDESVTRERNGERSATELLSPIPSFNPRPGGFYPEQTRSTEASLYESPYSSPRSPQARPLAARHDEIFGSRNIPQKSSGVVSKAMEYILGW